MDDEHEDDNDEDEYSSFEKSIEKAYDPKVKATPIAKQTSH